MQITIRLATVVFGLVCFAARADAVGTIYATSANPAGGSDRLVSSK
jgi:hypothetical protein